MANNDSEAGSDSADLTAAISLLDLNSSTQPILAVDQETLSNIPETSLPIKKRLNSAGQCHNALSNEEKIKPSDVNVNHTQIYVPRIKKMADNKDVDSGEESGERSNSTDQTAAVSPETSGAEEGAESGDHENHAASSSTIQTQDLESVSGTDPLETMDDPVDIIFELRRRLSRLKICISKALSDDEEQSTGLPPGPASRNLPPEDCLCFWKKLTLTDASHDDGKLDIEPLKAVRIPICPEIPKDDHDTRKSVELKVFDYENTQYNMLLTGYNYEGIVLYSINGEWRKFIRAHDLQHGDFIFFCKNLDQRINGDNFYYVILFAKMTDGDFIIEESEESGEDDEVGGESGEDDEGVEE